MSQETIAIVASYLGRAATALEARSDAELLADYAGSRDDSVFAVLVHRHGPLVLGVCRRALGHSADSDDAFQATFVALSRNADRIRSTLSGWLYRVAVRTTRKLLRKRKLESPPIVDRADPDDPFAKIEWREVRRVIDDELNRLPDRWRLPLILCYIEGLTRDEAAHRLGMSVRTTQRRVDEGRDKLQARLRKRGVAIVLLAGLVLDDDLRADVPTTLAGHAVSLASQGAVVPAAVRTLLSGPLFGGIAMKSTVFAGITLCIIGILFADRSPVSADPVPRGFHPNTAPVRAPLKKERPENPQTRKIREAHDKGIKFLKENQKEYKPGEWSWENPTAPILPSGGSTAIALLALLENGVSPNDEVVARGLKFLRTVKPVNTYVVALQTQVLCKANQKQDAKQIEENVKWLESGALRDGGKLKGWSYTEKNGGRADNSNTRYALAGLASAHRAGFKTIDPRLWIDARDMYVRTQKQDGGWGYMPEALPALRSTHTMTVSALLGMTVANEFIDKEDKPATDAIAMGMGWLAKEFTVVFQSHTFYNLDVIAALGRASDLKALGTKDKQHDWYRLGSEWLLKMQKETGEWRGDSATDAMPIISTSFALRFLASSPD